MLSGREVYGGFLAKAALTVSVDAEQAGDRLAQLINDKNLRLSMAEKARVRLRTTYDWKNIIPAYENLWADMAARRAASPPQKIKWPSALPTLPDPYTMYRSYPTTQLHEGDRLTLIASMDQIKALWQHEINNYASDIMMPANDIYAALGWLGQAGEVTISAFFTQFPALDAPRLWRTIGWLQKLGIIRNRS